MVAEYCNLWRNYDDISVRTGMVDAVMVYDMNSILGLLGISDGDHQLLLEPPR